MNDWDIEEAPGRNREVRWHTRHEAERQAQSRNDENAGVVRDSTAARWKTAQPWRRGA